MLNLHGKRQNKISSCSGHQSPEVRESLMEVHAEQLAYTHPCSERNPREVTLDGAGGLFKDA